MSAAGMIDQAEQLLAITLKFVALLCLHFCWAIAILDLYSVLIPYVVDRDDHFSFGARECRREEAQSKNLMITPKIQMQASEEPCSCDERTVDNESDQDVNYESTIIMFEAKVKMVMERLGLCSREADGACKIQLEPVGFREMATLFNHEREPRLEEVKEAFDVFDANTDGYIDVNELQKVLCALMGRVFYA